MAEKKRFTPKPFHGGVDDYADDAIFDNGRLLRYYEVMALLNSIPRLEADLALARDGVKDALKRASEAEAALKRHRAATFGSGDQAAEIARLKEELLAASEKIRTLNVPPTVSVSEYNKLVDEIARLKEDKDAALRSMRDAHAIVRLYREVADNAGCPNDASQYEWLASEIARLKEVIEIQESGFHDERKALLSIHDDQQDEIAKLKAESFDLRQEIMAYPANKEAFDKLMAENERLRNAAKNAVAYFRNDETLTGYGHDFIMDLARAADVEVPVVHEPATPAETHAKEGDAERLKWIAAYTRHTDRMTIIDGAVIARAVLDLQAEVAAMKRPRCTDCGAELRSGLCDGCADLYGKLEDEARERGLEPAVVETVTRWVSRQSSVCMIKDGRSEFEYLTIEECEMIGIPVPPPGECWEVSVERRADGSVLWRRK